MERYNYYIPQEDHLIDNSNVLIIDGIHSTRLVTNTILSKKGFVTNTLKKGSEVIKLMKTSRDVFGFILINIKEGIQVSTLLRKCGFKNPIIYYTEANVKNDQVLPNFPDSSVIYPLSTSNNTWALKTP